MKPEFKPDEKSNEEDEKGTPWMTGDKIEIRENRAGPASRAMLAVLIAILLACSIVLTVMIFRSMVAWKRTVVVKANLVLDGHASGYSEKDGHHDSVFFTITTVKFDGFIADINSKSLEVIIPRQARTCYLLPMKKHVPVEFLGEKTRPYMHLFGVHKFVVWKDNPITDKAFIGDETRNICRNRHVFWIFPIRDERDKRSAEPIKPRDDEETIEIYLV